MSYDHRHEQIYQREIRELQSNNPCNNKKNKTKYSNNLPFMMKSHSELDVIVVIAVNHLNLVETLDDLMLAISNDC